MPMADRGSRRLIVDGTCFRLVARVAPGPGFRGTCISVVAEHAERSGQRLVADYDPVALHGMVWPEIRPRDLRAVLEAGLEQGWRPAEPGPPFRLDEIHIFGSYPDPDYVVGFGEGRELLDAVLDAPDLFEPRMVLADWLIEHNDPRGTFIRAQCKGEPSANLLAEHWRAWSAPAFPVAHEWWFDRGFIDRVRVRDAFSLGDWWALHGREPVRSVTLPAHLLPELSPQFLQTSHREWEIVGKVEPAGAMALARVPRRALRGLDLRRTTMDSTVMRMVEGAAGLVYTEVRYPTRPVR